MKRISLLLIGFFLTSQSVWAGKIYRWTDSQGNVHFSSTPGPDQSANSYQGAGKSTQKSAEDFADEIFSGSWYGSSRTLTVRLDFDKNSDTLRWNGRPRGGGIKAEKFTAKWDYVNSDLELLYTSNQYEPEKAGTKEIIKIVEKSADLMLLQFPDGKVFRLNKRVKYKRLSNAERKIHGKWQVNDKQKSEWQFSSRGFEVKGILAGQYSRHTLASGNWSVEGDFLVLTHLNDRFMWHQTNKTGKVEKFKILLQDEGRLILKATKSDRQTVLNRKK